ncbi:caspase family protein [Dyadobacter sp. 32]|uniref:caspase family protein n=1 Tax=Dyadobacter sp. 32 TaxID=538966 RepID=UPI0011EFB2A2
MCAEKGLVTEKKLENIPTPIDKYYLLVIAIDSYQKNSLSNPVRDADALVKILTTDFTFFQPTDESEISSTRSKDSDIDDIIVYSSLQTKCLYNENATTNKIDDHIRAVHKKIGPNDAFLIYFSGHGDIDENNQTFQLVAYNEELLFTRLYDRSRKYETNCRHLLIIVDACFSGMGKEGIKTEDGTDSSRYYVASCDSDQKAKDGPPGDGSPFSKFLISKLRENETPKPELDSDFFEQFNKNQKAKRTADEIGDRINYKYQSLVSGVPEGASSGKTKLYLTKKKKGRPEPGFLRNSFIKNLGFGIQKQILKDDYSTLYNYLNILILQSYNLDARNFLAKSSFGHSIPESMKSNTEILCDRFEIKDEKLKDAIFTNLLTEKSIKSIVNYFIEKIISIDSKKIFYFLLIDFIDIGKNYVEEIDNFCKEFCLEFCKKHKEVLLQKKDADIGQLFIFFTDVSKNSDGWVKRDFKQVKGLDESNRFNFIDLGNIKPIRKPHFNEWREDILVDKVSTTIQELANDEKILTLFKIDDLNKFTCEHDKFVEKICTHCGFNDEEFKREFSNHMYNFPKMISNGN